MGGGGGCMTKTKTVRKWEELRDGFPALRSGYLYFAVLFSDASELDAPNGDYVSCNRDRRQRAPHAELLLTATTAGVTV